MKVAVHLVLVAVLALAAGCRATETRATLQPEWGPEWNGVSTRLIPLAKRFVLGQPMKFRLEMKNVSDSTLKYDDQQVDTNYSMIIEDSSGRIAPYVDFDNSTCGGPELIKPGEIHVLFEEYNVERDYHIDRPGRYSFRFDGESPGYGDVRIPPSNTVKVEVLDGEVDPSYAFTERLLSLLPENWKRCRGPWHLVRHPYVESAPTGRHICLCAHATFIWSSLIKFERRSIQVYLTETPVSVLEPTPEEVSEYLGEGSGGHVYIEVDQEGEKFWLEIRKDVSKALGIRTK